MSEPKQCSTCAHWERRAIERGRCHSLQYRPDPEFGYNTLDSDGCKHWQDATLLRRCDDIRERS